MRVMFDTSVPVTGLVPAHVDHKPAYLWMTAAQQGWASNLLNWYKPTGC